MHETVRRTRLRVDLSSSVMLAVLLIFTGLAVDSGRAYVVKAQLSKAVDGAALAAARSLNSGDPKGEAVRIFKANFPTGYFGTLTATDPTADPGFFTSTVDPATGVNTVTVNATTTLPTTFMQLGQHQRSPGRERSARRRAAWSTSSLVLDVSSSIGSQVDRRPRRDARVRRLVRREQRSRRAADVRQRRAGARPDAVGAAASTRPRSRPTSPAPCRAAARTWSKGSIAAGTSCASVPAGQQSGLRVIVLFTDGASNSVPGNYDAAPGLGRALRTFDFPKNSPDPDGQTWDNPQHRRACYDTSTGTRRARRVGITVGELEQQVSRRGRFRDRIALERRAVSAAHELSRLPPQLRDPDRVPVACRTR